MNDETKARMVIGGLMSIEARDDLAKALAETDLWIGSIDEDDNRGRDPMDDHACADRPALWAEAIVECLYNEDVLVIIANDESLMEASMCLGTEVFDNVQTVVEAHGLISRRLSRGVIDEYGRRDRKATTFTNGNTYEAICDMAGNPVIRIRSYDPDPDMLLKAARQAFMAGMWRIPQLSLLRLDEMEDA